MWGVSSEEREVMSDNWGIRWKKISNNISYHRAGVIAKNIRSSKKILEVQKKNFIS